MSKIKTRLLLIEDNSIIRDIIIAGLKPYKDITILASSCYGKNILKKIKQLNPNVILLNLELRSQNCLHLVEKVKNDFPQAKVIIKGLTPEQGDIFNYIKAGANGFILQDSSIIDFLITIRKVTEGSNILPPPLVDTLFYQIADQTIRGDESKLKAAIFMKLLEPEIIRLIREGFNNKEIGKKIAVSFNNAKSPFS